MHQYKMRLTSISNNRTKRMNYGIFISYFQIKYNFKSHFICDILINFFLNFLYRKKTIKELEL